jgi:hypothetical protein
MKCTIKLSENEDYVLLQIDADFTSKEMMEWVIESHTLGREKGVRSYLVDVRNARNIDSAFGKHKFAYSDMKKTETADKNARVAALIRPNDDSHDFVELASNNAGMNMKLFTDIDEAIEFLIK